MERTVEKFVIETDSDDSKLGKAFVFVDAVTEEIGLLSKSPLSQSGNAQKKTLIQ
jgi:hypothetical protein